MATKAKIVEPKSDPVPTFILTLPAHVDAVDVTGLDCQTRDLVGSALGCNFRVSDGLLFADDGRAFKIDVVGRELRLT